MPVKCIATIARPTGIAAAHGVLQAYVDASELERPLKELIGACNRLGILIDLSHLNERGFWDVAAISNAPLVATHSNAHALSPHSRNLTDKQLTVIGETGGMVGVNFATTYLRPDGRQDADTPVDLVIEHLEHILKHVGEDGVPKDIPDKGSVEFDTGYMRSLFEYGYELGRSGRAWQGAPPLPH